MDTELADENRLKGHLSHAQENLSTVFPLDGFIRFFDVLGHQ